MEKVKVEFIDGKERAVFLSPEDRDKFLFTKTKEGYKKICIPERYKDRVNEFLQSFDLSGIDWSNVDIRGIDFRGTNAQINPRVVYGRKLNDTNFEGMDMNGYSFRGANIKGAKLNNTNAHIYNRFGLLNYSLIMGCYLNGKKTPDLTIMDAEYECISDTNNKRKTKKKINFKLWG